MNSSQQHAEEAQDSCSQHQEEDRVAEVPITEYSTSQSKMEPTTDAHDGDGQDEVDKLPAAISHALLLDSEANINVPDQTKTEDTPSAKHTFLSWWLEIAWCAFATGLMVALVGLLSAYDKKPAPEWPVTLNTVVAAISTICRAAMMIPVSEGLSQLKWNSFAQHQRPLNDLQTFDQASRGPFGSLVLLSKSRGRLLGVSTVAAFILISGLATSSLTQATIAYGQPLRRQAEDAVMSKANGILMSKVNGSIEFDDWDRIRSDLRNAAFGAFFISEGSRESLQLKPSCPSSCHWSNFRSLDVCDVQQNVTGQLELELQDPGDFQSRVNVEKWMIKLGPGFQMNDTNLYPNAFASHSPSRSLAMALWKDDKHNLPTTNIITHVFIYKSHPDDRFYGTYNGTRSPYRAVMVTWYWCIREYRINVSPNTAHIKATETDFYILNGTETDPNIRDIILVNNLTAERFPIAQDSYPMALDTDWQMVTRNVAGIPAILTNAAFRILSSSENDTWDNIGIWKEDATMAMSAV